jgi:nucleoside-diphosphate-sugar epimerase
MNVVIVGGHGQVALLMSKLLSERGDRVHGLIRTAHQAPDLERVGAEPVVADFLRDGLADAVAGADAVVFAAGSAQGAGAEGKRTVDLGGAVKLIDAARAAGINRYVLISAIGVRNAEEPPLIRVPLKAVRVLWPEMRAYFAAKAESEDRLRASGLDFTIVRPGRLTDDPARGLIAAAPHVRTYGKVSRGDVAATLVETLNAPNTIGKTFSVIAGHRPIAETVAAL